MDNIKNQIFGELINRLNQKKLKIEQELKFYKSHLSDYEIGIGRKKPFVILEEHKELLQQVEKGLEDIVSWEITDSTDLSLLKPPSIEQLKSWYSIQLEEENGTEKLGQIIEERILAIKRNLDEIKSKKKKHLGLIDNFSDETKKENWIKEWIDIEIPNEMDELF